MRNQVQELESSDDCELLAAVREGNDAAFGELYRRHVGAGRAAARALTRSAADADDAVAEAFARVLAVMRRGGGPEVAMRPYLMTVVRNVCFDRGATRDRETLPGETEVMAAVDELPSSYQNADLDHFTEANLVSRAFASLSDRWKHVLWQTDIEGRTPRELADELDLAPTAVAALAFRAREGLADAYLAAHVQHRPTALCSHEPSELARYVRNRMRSKEEVSFRAHLDQCNRCSEAVEELRVVSRPLRSLQWPALIGAPVITYGGKVIGVIRRVVTAQLMTTAGAAAVTVATVSVATNQMPFEPFDALRPKSYVEAHAAGPVGGQSGTVLTPAAGAPTSDAAAPEATPHDASGAGAPGSTRSAASSTTTAIPTISFGSGGATVVMPSTTGTPSSPTTAAPPAAPAGSTPTTDAAATPPVTTDGSTPATPAPSIPGTPEHGTPTHGGNDTSDASDGGSDAPSTPSTPTTVQIPTATTPVMSGGPIGGSQTQSNDEDEATTTTTTPPTTTTTTTPEETTTTTEAPQDPPPAP